MSGPADGPPEVIAFQPGDEIFGYNDGPFGTHAEYSEWDTSVQVLPTIADVGPDTFAGVLPERRAGTEEAGDGPRCTS